MSIFFLFCWISTSTSIRHVPEKIWFPKKRSLSQASSFTSNLSDFSGAGLLLFFYETACLFPFLEHMPIAELNCMQLRRVNTNLDWWILEIGSFSYFTSAMGSLIPNLPNSIKMWFWKVISRATFEGSSEEVHINVKGACISGNKVRTNRKKWHI